MLFSLREGEGVPALTMVPLPPSDPDAKRSWAPETEEAEVGLDSKLRTAACCLLLACAALACSFAVRGKRGCDGMRISMAAAAAAHAHARAYVHACACGDSSGGGTALIVGLHGLFSNLIPLPSTVFLNQLHRR